MLNAKNQHGVNSYSTAQPSTSKGDDVDDSMADTSEVPEMTE